MSDPALQCLVVDDDAGMRTLVQLHLTAVGGEVLTASTGQEAEDVLAARPVAMVVVDRNLGGQSGVATLRAAARHGVAERVLISAHVNERVRQEAAEVAAHAVDKADLAPLVSRWAALVHARASHHES